jgi:hypothetical protein
MIRTRSLPKLPIVVAQSVLHAQGYVPTASERAAIDARADFFESEGLCRDVHVAVIDIYSGARIGSIIVTS